MNKRENKKMKDVILAIIFFGFVALLFTGCATTIPFQYQHPESTQSGYTDMSIAYSYVNDQRAEKDTDKIFESCPVEDLNKTIGEEIRSTGLFRKVISIPPDKMDDEKYLQNQDIDFVMNSSLKEMKWEIPDYDKIQTTIFIVSFLTGGIGGVIYGSTDSDIYGDMKQRITLIEQNSGKILLDKEYTGHIEERKTKFKCDTLKTKAEI